MEYGRTDGNNVNILYIHGMGGGADSRIPGILKERINDVILKERINDVILKERINAVDLHIDVIVRTYDFNPQIGREQIASWVRELHPALVVGESLGALNAIIVKDLPHILVSPSLNAPIYLGYLAPLALIPGVTRLLDRIYRPKEGDRQKLHFTFNTLRCYREHRAKALNCSTLKGGKDYFHAFFGLNDHYRKSGIVSIRTWMKYFGADSFTIYPGCHYMEEEFIESLLIPKIIETVKRLRRQ